MRAPIYAWLAADADCAAALPDPEVPGTIKVFPDIAPEGTQVSYVTHLTVGRVPQAYLAERPDMDYVRTQVNCWAADSAAAAVLAKKVEAALEVQGYFVVLVDDSEDPETKRWRYAFDFEFWIPRT